MIFQTFYFIFRNNDAMSKGGRPSIPYTPDSEVLCGLCKTKLRYDTLQRHFKVVRHSRPMGRSTDRENMTFRGTDLDFSLNGQIILFWV